MKIGNYVLRNNGRPFIVAEAGINHGGIHRRALEMIHAAKEAGCDAIKYQSFRAEEFCTPGQNITYRSQGEEITEPMIDLFKRHELPDYVWQEIKTECERVGIVYLSTPMGKESLALLVSDGIDAIKVTSSDLTNIGLLHAMANTALPIIISTGMAESGEIYSALLAAGAAKVDAQVVAAVCTSEYPTAAANANIRRLCTLRNSLFEWGMNSVRIGLSDHTVGNEAAVLAVAYGACYFEKHFTPWHGHEGPDHHFSANPEQLRSWVNAIRTAHEMVGSGKLEPTESELRNRVEWRKAIVAAEPIRKGEQFIRDKLTVKRVKGGGKDPSGLQLMSEWIADRDYAKDEPL